MPGDIIDSLNRNDLNEFRKDFTELIRVHSGINKEYSKSGRDTDEYITAFKKAAAMFNRKYKGMVAELEQTAEELKLRIFLKESF